MTIQVMRTNDAALSTIIPNLAQYDYRILSADRDYSDEESYTEYLEIELTDKTVVTATKEVKENVQMNEASNRDYNSNLPATEKQIKSIIMHLTTHVLKDKQTIKFPVGPNMTKSQASALIHILNEQLTIKRAFDGQNYAKCWNWVAKRYPDLKLGLRSVFTYYPDNHYEAAMDIE